VVLARISDDGFGSRVRGRAGVDLASLGLIGAVAWIGFLSIYVFALRGGDLPSALLFCGVAVIPGAVLWLRLVSPVDADPLVRFIRRVLEKPTKRSIEVVPSHFDRTPVQPAKLNVNGREIGAPSESDAAQAILAMKPNEFLIIDFGSNNFMQTALEYDRFILEKCEGNDHELFRAKGDFDANEVIAVMAAYLRGAQSSKPVVWEKVRG
jgi:hypothetical protein